MSKKIFQRRNWIFRVGVILIVFWSIITGVLNLAVLYFFGIPLLGLLLGIGLVWAGKANIKTKILLTFLPIPIILSIFFLLLELNKAEPETFLIPQNFRGQFEIVFNEPCGQSIIYEKGRRNYQIPSDGILITKTKETMGVIDRKFYLVDENDNRTQVPEFHSDKFEEEKGDWHWVFSKIKLSEQSVGVFWAYRNGFSFIVSDYLSLEEQNKETQDKKREEFDNKVNLALKQCRQTR